MLSVYIFVNTVGIDLDLTLLYSPGMTPEKIIKLRNAHGWPQHELAKRLETTQASISRYEGGVRPVAGPAKVLLQMMYDHTFTVEREP